MRALVEAIAAIDLPLAHDIGVPHQDPRPVDDGGGSASTIVIVVVIVATLVLAGALIWLRERARRADDEPSAPAAD